MKMTPATQTTAAAWGVVRMERHSVSIEIPFYSVEDRRVVAELARATLEQPGAAPAVSVAARHIEVTAGNVRYMIPVINGDLARATDCAISILDSHVQGWSVAATAPRQAALN